MSESSQLLRAVDRPTAAHVRNLVHLVLASSHRYSEVCEQDGPYEWDNGQRGTFCWFGRCTCGAEWVGGPNPYGLMQQWQDHADDALAEALTSLLGGSDG